MEQTYGRLETVLEREVVMDLSRPTYWLVGELTSMREAVWRNVRVTVREELHGAGLLAKELQVMKNLAHPQLLLLMGFIPSGSCFKLIFEYVELGSLYTCLHETPLLSPVRLITKVDVMLQITDALVFLHSRGLIHRQICSHVVQLVSYRTAKLGGLEWTVTKGTMCSLRAQSGWRSLVAWAPPELVEGGLQRATTQADVYSLCCVLWEVVTRCKPWGELTSAQIVRQVRRGAGLPLHRSSLPRYIYRLLHQGLVWEEKERDLDLQEVRDMLLVTRREQEEILAGLRQKTSASDKEKMSNTALQSQVTRYTTQDYFDPVTSEDSSEASEYDAEESDVSQDKPPPTYHGDWISESSVGKYVGNPVLANLSIHIPLTESTPFYLLSRKSIQPDVLHTIPIFYIPHANPIPIHRLLLMLYPQIQWTNFIRTIHSIASSSLPPRQIMHLFCLLIRGLVNLDTILLGRSLKD